MASHLYAYIELCRLTSRIKVDPAEAFDSTPWQELLLPVAATLGGTTLLQGRDKPRVQRPRLIISDTTDVVNRWSLSPSRLRKLTLMRPSLSLFFGKESFARDEIASTRERSCSIKASIQVAHFDCW